MSDNLTLAHYGVPGMKWGVRKNKPTGEVVLSTKLKGGGSLTITKDPPSSAAKFLSKLSPGLKKNSEASSWFTLTDGEGKKVGDANFYQTSKESLDLAWLGVKKSERGKGYASAAMKGVVAYSKANGIKKLTLEVPGNSPDALHIYEKLGFKATKATSASGDIWDGLTEMVMDIPQKKLKHSEDFGLDLEKLLDYIATAVNKYTTESEDDLSHENFKEVSEEEFLAHYGVPGMKWGKRQARTAGGSKSPSQRAQKRADYKKKLSNMSPKQRALHDLKQRVKLIGLGLAVNAAVRGGVSWAANNPDKINKIFDKAKGMANKQQAITKGYTIIKASMGANGTWKV